ncbi:hypothetical protein [Mesorhizobium sophorae]|uniref:hypothetical protein n=1 Tax=Mesorhizobium sophorae TaxID=1300294 RepID=UPI000BA3F49D|nr:hypothetical protein [Mesorhizobium sophorae]
MSLSPRSTMLRVAALLCLLAPFELASLLPSRAEEPTDYSGEVPVNLRGPFIFEPDVVVTLDCNQHSASDGPLNFRTLIEAKARKYEELGQKNPFLLGIAEPIQRTLSNDLNELTTRADAKDFQLHTEFLTDPGSRIELVGVINRMDRQFITDASLTPAQRSCGEISVIYRFSYDLANGRKSRLPVTMNIVFPALPGDTHGGAVTCQSVAQRWVDELARPVGRTPAKKVQDLLDAQNGPLATIRGEDMLRIEINAQVYRKPAGVVRDFGSEAEYLIRVFHWEAKAQEFQPIGLTNQIDRDSLLCGTGDGGSACNRKKALRAELVAYLQTPAAVADVDAGTLELPEKYLSKRAVSVSPGGVHRARNQPFWKAGNGEGKSRKSDQEIISDDELWAALKRFDETGQRLSFIKSPDDFRTRLNDSTCTGCHQTRAIAGFHFPGADRQGTPAANSVFLPGSPLFFGDQPRRTEIVSEIAKRPSGRLSTYELAIGYSARPLNKLQSELSGTQLLGGWGGACTMPQFLASTQRQWTCQAGLACKQFYKSENERIVGTCVPENYSQVGDQLQVGTISSPSFELDSYIREFPKAYPEGADKNNLIDGEALKKIKLPPLTGNSYYGAHQEYYAGKDCKNGPCSLDELRDAQTGGFPAGMLRLSECQGLGPTSTCGLIASTGFNSCLDRITQPGSSYTQNICFLNFTSFAGMRACDAADPCRDDYICVSPVATSPEDFKAYYDTRSNALTKKPYFNDIVGKPYSAAGYYGQRFPDRDWLDRQDHRGLCIPPYFVFQFRSDKHPKP